MLAFIDPTAGRVDIDIAIAFARSSSSIVVESPSYRPSPSSCRCGCAVPCCRATPSITLYSPSRCPSTPVAVVLSVHHRRARAIPRRRGAIAPSLTAEEPLRRPLPSKSRVLTDDSGHSSRPFQASHPDGCCVASPHSAAFHLPEPFIAASPFVPLVRPAGCCVLSLLTPPPPICRHHCLSWRRRLLSRPSWASRPAG